MEASEASNTKNDIVASKRVEACESRLLEKMGRMEEMLDEMKTLFVDEFKSLENEIKFLKMKNEKLEENMKLTQQGKTGMPEKEQMMEKYIAVTSPCSPDAIDILTSGSCTTVGFIGRDTPLLSALAPRALVSQGMG